MAAKYHLEIITPQRRFFEGEVEALTFTSSDGSMCIMRGHAPMVATVSIGEIYIDTGEARKIAVCSEGIVDVYAEKTLLFAQTVEWPDEIDINRAIAAKERAEEELRQARSMQEYTESRARLARAISRLRITSQHNEIE